MTKLPEAAYRTFFTADEHYGHRNVLNFCKRPFADIDEMERELIARHNAKVPKGGLTYHLGDMFWRTLTPVHAATILSQLSGQHYFVWGNHDELLEENEDLRNRFHWTKEIARVQIKGFKSIVLCHYAMRVWRGSHNGSWHLYGHSHGDLDHTHNTKSFDVGVDANNYEPVSLAEVAVKMESRHVIINHPPCGRCGLCLDCLRIEAERHG